MVFFIPYIYKTLLSIYNIPRIFSLGPAWALLYGGGGRHVLEDFQTEVGLLQKPLSPCLSSSVPKLNKKYSPPICQLLRQQRRHLASRAFGNLNDPLSEGEMPAGLGLWDQWGLKGPNGS